MAKKINNKIPLTSLKALKDEIKWQDYIDKDLFAYYCDLCLNHEGERLTIDIKNDDLTAKEGVVYVLVINDRILKIGQSIQTFKGRLVSYNSGTKKLRKKGTNSITNYFILQSILHISLPVRVYLMAPKHREWKELDKEGTEASPSVKVWERILLERFGEQYGKTPIGNSQK